MYFTCGLFIAVHMVSLFHSPLGSGPCFRCPAAGFFLLFCFDLGRWHQPWSKTVEMPCRWTLRLLYFILGRQHQLKRGFQLWAIVCPSWEWISPSSVVLPKVSLLSHWVFEFFLAAKESLRTVKPGAPLMWTTNIHYYIHYYCCFVLPCAAL